MSPYKGATVRTVDDELAWSLYDIRLLLEPEAVRRAVELGGTTHWEAANGALDGPRPPPTGPTARWPTGSSTARSTSAAATT